MIKESTMKVETRWKAREGSSNKGELIYEVPKAVQRRGNRFIASTRADVKYAVVLGTLPW